MRDNKTYSCTDTAMAFTSTALFFHVLLANHRQPLEAPVAVQGRQNPIEPEKHARKAQNTATRVSSHHASICQPKHQKQGVNPHVSGNTPSRKMARR